MSVIAKSLKKHTRSQKTVNDSKSYQVKIFSINMIFILITLLFIVFVGTYIIVQYQSVSTANKLKFPSINSLNTQFNSELKKISSPVKREIEQEIRFLLSTRKMEELYSLAKREEYKKFLGIFYYISRQYELAENYLRADLSTGNNDVETGSYLAAVYMKQKKYHMALNILNSLDKNKFQILYNIAVTQEVLGNTEQSLEYYLKSINSVRDPLMKYKMKVKIFLLQRKLLKVNN